MQRNKRKHTHWTVICFDKENSEGNYVQPVELTINDCVNEEWAISEAKIMIDRKNYILRKVWECNQCTLHDKAEKLIDKQMGDGE